MVMVCCFAFAISLAPSAVDIVTTTGHGYARSSGSPWQTCCASQTGLMSVQVEMLLGALLTMTAPVAPAVRALRTFSENEIDIPREMTAMRPRVSGGTSAAAP